MEESIFWPTQIPQNGIGRLALWLLSSFKIYQSKGFFYTNSAFSVHPF